MHNSPAAAVVPRMPLQSRLSERLHRWPYHGWNRLRPSSPRREIICTPYITMLQIACWKAARQSCLLANPIRATRRPHPMDCQVLQWDNSNGTLCCKLVRNLPARLPLKPIPRRKPSIHSCPLPHRHHPPRWLRYPRKIHIPRNQTCSMQLPAQSQQLALLRIPPRARFLKPTRIRLCPRWLLWMS